jgi:hypothetical protein
MSEEVEVPEWFKEFMFNFDSSYKELRWEVQKKDYSIFLKHYPKQDTLPVEEIAENIALAFQSAWDKVSIYRIIEQQLSQYLAQKA